MVLRSVACVSAVLWAAVVLGHLQSLMLGNGGQGRASEETECIVRQIDLQDAYAHFTEGTAIFVDARGPGQFGRSHVRGAINIKPGFERDRLLDRLPVLKHGMVVITYCDGRACQSSLLLAQAFCEVLEGRPVFTFSGGWQEWKEAGLPTGQR